jgi:cell pole-organizing protein PopZ
MASPANPQHEPTMEEILASIRKIISEDSSDAAAPAAGTVQEESEILELTEEVPPESAQGLRAAEPDEVVFKEVEEPKMAESSNSLSAGSEMCRAERECATGGRAAHIAADRRKFDRSGVPAHGPRQFRAPAAQPS